jgi:hypothetical protein
MNGFAPDEPTVGSYVGSIATLLVGAQVVSDDGESSST